MCGQTSSAPATSSTPTALSASPSHTLMSSPPSPSLHRLHSSPIVPTTFPPKVGYTATLPTDPTTHTALSASPYTTPVTPLSALPTHFTLSPPFFPPPLTAFTPLPLSPPSRPCCPWFGFSSYLEASNVCPTPLPSSTPTALGASPSHTLRRHHHHPHCPHRSPPSPLCHCSHHLAAQSWLHPHRPTALYVVTTITLTAPTAHRPSLLPLSPYISWLLTTKTCGLPWILSFRGRRHWRQPVNKIINFLYSINHISNQFIDPLLFVRKIKNTLLSIIESLTDVFFLQHI